MAHTEIAHHIDDEADRTGWYAFVLNDAGEEDDAIGPFDTEDEAKEAGYAELQREWDEADRNGEDTIEIEERMGMLKPWPAR